MSETTTQPRGQKLLRLGVIGVAAALVAIGGGAIIKGLDGGSTVRSSLANEKIVGTPLMTPTAIAAATRKAGVQGVALPDCSVAGKPITDGASARCFAQYMRIDALNATGGKTYAQMPRFLGKDGNPTSDESLAQKLPNGVGVPNPARNVWVTETALSTALNTSYMAEQISLFGTVVGAALLLMGVALGGIGIRLGATRVRQTDSAPAREPKRASAMSHA